jgi:hypothetical protein
VQLPPVWGSGLHPGQPQPEQSWHVAADGVPAHRGGAVNSRGAEGASRAGDLQQISRGQSLFWVHTLVQLAAQIPRQQSGVEGAPMQSSDDSHVRGQVAFDGLRHTPRVESAGSTVDAEVQQISPSAVLQSESAEHPGEQSPGVVQMGVE